MQDEKQKVTDGKHDELHHMREVFRQHAEKQLLIIKVERWSRVAGLAVFVLATIVMVGWLLELQALRHFLDWLVTMKANTALSFLLSGVALWLLRGEPTPGAKSVFHDRRRLLGAGYALIVIVIGLLTYAEYVFRVQLGIDHLFFLQSLAKAGRLHTGPMEMETATNFILIGVALWVLNIRHYRWVIQVLVSLVVIITASSLLGVFSGIVPPGGAKPISPMATLTVVTFFLLCVGLLLAVRQFNWRH